MLSTVLGGLLLARVPDSPVAKELLPSISDGSEHLAVALDAGQLCARRSSDGGLVVDGRVAHSTLLEVFTSEGFGTMVVPS